MKKGQLLSQPFFYIFALIVIALLLIFGFTYIRKLMNTGCGVESISFISDIQTKVNEIYSLSYGSSYECALTRVAGKTNNKCEIVMPDNVDGICFVDTTKSYDPANIIFDEPKKLIVGLGVNANNNLYFQNSRNAACKSEPALIKKLTTDGVVCLDFKKTNPSFILENIGNNVVVKKA